MNTELFGLKTDYNQLKLRFDAHQEALWTYFNQQDIVPCANLEIVNELDFHQKQLASSQGVVQHNNELHSIKYSVSASLTPNVYNLGGQLSLIKQLAQQRNKDALLSYAVKAIDLMYQRLIRFNNAPIINISLIQGLALGGGLEGALVSDVVFAERKSMLSFPEVHFNMFPGMGGYSLVSRKAGNAVADEMIFKGKQYTAEQAHEMGIVDFLVEDGQGEKAVFDWINKNKRFFNSHLAIYKAKNRVNPISYDELLDITKMWVDVALKLSDREYSIMDRFIYSQEKQYLAQKEQYTAESNVLLMQRKAS
jgi:DSF synthase